MIQSPAGTVTFLFTDIEGSTKLWQQYPDRMEAALKRHHAILNDAIAAHGGYVFQIIGDAFCAAFQTANDGLDAALEVQRSLITEKWGETGAIHVRMALHTGRADLQPGQFKSGEYMSGLTLSRTARLLSAGYGGQILLTLATAELVRDHLPDEINLRDLGTRRLKDLVHPEQIFQVVAPDLLADFPPLKTLDVHPHNLPVQLTSFIGREREMIEIKKLLASTHLLTLTGIGGTGKTRLALQVIADLIDEFPDGVWLVELAPLRDPALVDQTIASVLGVRVVADRPLVEVLKDELRDKQLLLVLDNFEQVVSAALRVSELLRYAPGLKVLATSRVALHLRGEITYTVPTLSLPTGNLIRIKESGQITTLFSNEAVRLFVERAVMVKPEFTITEENIGLVADICLRLDGLPLGIELAAARIKHLPIHALLKRLSSRLDVLTSGERDLPERQQTLRRTLDWSYELLTDNERYLFKSLCAFPGGCSLEAAEAVCGLPDSSNALDLLASLVDNSLLIQRESHEGEPRYWMLETIREYALAQLGAGEEAAIVWRKQLHFINGLAEVGENEINGPNADYWYKRFQAEIDNVRATLNWVLESKYASEQDLEVAAWILGRCWVAWYQNGDLSEGRRWATLILARLPMHIPARAKLLNAAGCFSWLQGDYSAAAPFLVESVRLWREFDNESGLAEALHFQGHLIFDQKHFADAGILYQESRELYERLGDLQSVLPLIGDLGMVAYHLGDYKKARVIYEECLVLSRERGSKDNIAQTLYRLGDLARLENDHYESEIYYKQGLAAFREMGTKLEIACGLHKLGCIALYRQDPSQAYDLFSESLKIQKEAGNKQGIAECLFGIAGVAGTTGQLELATQLFGAGQALIDTIGAPLAPADQLDYEHDLADVRSKLYPEIFERAWQAGREMPLEQALEMAKQSVNEKW